jgi:hypothetical protein
MIGNESAEAIHRAASAATYGGSGMAVYFGFTAGEWQVIGVIGGLFIGFVGLAVNTYFQWKRSKP